MRENEDVGVTTGRMLRLAKETEDIADATVVELKNQNDKLENLQDEMALIHDDLNTSEKNMKKIKSFWGGFSTMGSSRTHNQHQKMRVKEEAGRDKELAVQDKIETKVNAQNEKIAVKQNNQQMSQFVHDHKKEIHQGKKEAMKEAKDVKKGRAELTDDKFVSSGHVFEFRGEGSGPKCQAENDLDEIAKIASGLNNKAKIMSDLVDESQGRIGRVNDEIVRANVRTTNLNKQADKYTGKR